jgi:predicted MFS family arabinose efflux permease
MIEDQKSNSSTSTGSSSRRSLVLALVILAQFMVVIDFTIVQVALPSIGREFGISVNGLQWIVSAYGLTLAGFLMLSGRMGDIYGHKRLFIIGVLLFSLASLTGGLAPSEIVLIVARVLQGLGAAMASATGLSRRQREKSRPMHFCGSLRFRFCCWNDFGRCDYDNLRMEMGV